MASRWEKLYYMRQFLKEQEARRQEAILKMQEQYNEQVKAQREHEHRVAVANLLWSLGE